MFTGKFAMMDEGIFMRTLAREYDSLNVDF